LYKVELEEEGYKILLASKAQEALEILKNEQPDLIVTDSMMSGINKSEGLQRIVEKSRRIPIVINVAFPQFKENCTPWGESAEYVVKSGDLQELKDTISNILSRQ
jgi:DNA-binding response OmpR family regulator